MQLTAIAGDSYEDIAFEASVSLAGAGSGSTMTLLDTSVTVAPCHGHRALPITDVRIGARVLTGNPRPEEFDTAFPEPDQATWVTLALDLMKREGVPGEGGVPQASWLGRTERDRRRCCSPDRHLGTGCRGQCVRDGHFPMPTDRRGARQGVGSAAQPTTTSGPHAHYARISDGITKNRAVMGRNVYSKTRPLIVDPLRTKAGTYH